MPELVDRVSFPNFYINLANIIMLCTFVLLPDIPVYEINMFLYRKKTIYPLSRLLWYIYKKLLFLRVSITIKPI